MKPAACACGSTHDLISPYVDERGRKLPIVECRACFIAADMRSEALEREIALSAWRLATARLESLEAAAFAESGEGRRARGIAAEPGDEKTKAHRIEVAIVDFRERLEAEARNATKKPATSADTTSAVSPK